MVGGLIGELVERETELGEAGEVLDGARGGAGAALLVEGPAGIGKSALIRAIRANAAAGGFTVMSARGAELEREFSFGVVRQLFEPALAAADESERGTLLAGAASLAEPAIGKLAAAQSAEASPTSDPSFAVLHGLYWLASNLADRAPLLIAVDDCHWCDPASLRFLVYLAGRLEGLPVLLAIGIRPFEPGSPVDLLEALERESVARVLRLAPLSQEGTGAVVRSRLESGTTSDFAAACHQASGGNPQLIRELLAALAAEGTPPTPEGAAQVTELRADRIAASLLARVGRLGPGAVELARSVAVLGRDASPESVAELAGLSDEGAAQAIEALGAVEILVPGDPLDFVHPIVRTAVYHDAAASVRGDAHWRAARLLADRGAALESVAAQIVAAPPAGDAWAVRELTRAGESALARGAPEAAVSYLQRALGEQPDDDARREVLVGLGRSFAMLRDIRRCVKRLYEALDLTQDSRRRAEIVHLLISMLAISRAAARGVELLEREIDALPEHEWELGLKLESDVDSMTFFSLSAKRAADPRRRRFEDPDDAGSMASAAMRTAIYDGPATRAAELAERAWGDGRLLAREGPDAPTVWMAGWAMLYAHELRRTRELANDWAREASRLGSLRAYSIALTLRNRALYWMGDLVDAEADVRAFLEGWPEAIGLGPAFLADILAEQGRLNEAERALSLGRQADERVEWSFFFPMLLESRGKLAARQGRFEAARTSLLDSGRAAEEWGIQTPGPLQWRVYAAQVLASVGHVDDAHNLVEHELESCRRYGSDRALGRAMVAAGLIRGEGGVDALREAAFVLSGSEARLEYARALVVLGAALRRTKHVAEARERLREGLSIARACGAQPLAEQAYEELVATGARPRKIVRSGIDALTASERRVASMAAEGMTNKEIAQALFVTVRTVEAHLHHAYQKLDISSRTELAGMLRDTQRDDRP
jgi:DNA-binding CsgD family transcriptional regulator